MGNIEAVQEPSLGREAVGKASGKRIEDTEMHLRTFGGDGSITAPRRFVDTFQHAEAQGS